MLIDEFTSKAGDGYLSNDLEQHDVVVQKAAVQSINKKIKAEEQIMSARMSNITSYGNDISPLQQSIVNNASCGCNWLSLDCMAISAEADESVAIPRIEKRKNGRVCFVGECKEDYWHDIFGIAWMKYYVNNQMYYHIIWIHNAVLTSESSAYPMRNNFIIGKILAFLYFMVVLLFMRIPLLLMLHLTHDHIISYFHPLCVALAPWYSPSFDVAVRWCTPESDPILGMIKTTDDAWVEDRRSISIPGNLLWHDHDDQQYTGVDRKVWYGKGQVGAGSEAEETEETPRSGS